MGKLEKEVKLQIRKTKIQRAVLNSIFAVGVISVALLAPNAMTILKYFDGGKKRKNNPKYLINKTARRLQERGLIMFEKTDKGTFLRLTPLGEKHIDRLDQDDFKIKHPKKWDGKWRVIIFDIKETRRLLRDKVRLTLSRIGFVRLQNSVWVFPYDCEDLMMLLKADFRIGKDMLYLIVDKIEYDTPLRKKFNL